MLDRGGGVCYIMYYLSVDRLVFVRKNCTGKCLDFRSGRQQVCYKTKSNKEVPKNGCRGKS